MQIFDDKKKRIGTLSGFKDRAITTTLDSGDKEMTFSYPALGALADMLKEEYYIRTKTDEFVIKAIEKGERYNKYTATLNVEELEGIAFPYGFESDEQTIKACLEFAFDGSGWHIGTCTVTKKRTIDEQESVTAWDVLQKCLSTYRCECIIRSLTKTVDIYERIGSDKGCYFMEGLNLRKISLKSDTYDFYTRIYPIGKDGITPKGLTGKDYIDNFQYSSKVKACVWKDERYTNTTSLIEDATAKLEEMSRPYKAYTAEVVDLAKASEEHKDILAYGIGDTVTLVSKTINTKEKQRIVKITEYPETPEKNTVEISNARKTFAEIQREETKTAAAEAVSISNRTAKKMLENYSTTEEIETKIAASNEEIEISVEKTLESYSTKEATKAAIKEAAGNITLEVDKTKNELKEQSAKIEVNSSKIEQKVTKGELSAEISLEAGEVAFRGNRVTIEADNFSLTKSGEISATGKFITKDETYGLQSIQQSAGMKILHDGDELGRFGSGSAGEVKGIGIGTNKLFVIHNESSIGYIYNHAGLITQYPQRHIFSGDTHFVGSISCGGSKNRAVQTENYGTIAMNAVESASPIFIDVGSGRIGEDGCCYVFIDEEYRETIDERHEYYFFVTAVEKECSCVCTEKTKDYVKVEGKSNAEFSWMICAKQKGYAADRMEKIDVPSAAFINNEDMTQISDLASDSELEQQAFEYLQNYEREIEA